MSRLILLVFSFYGKCIRYVVFRFISFLKGTPPKDISYFNKDNQQQIKNLLVTWVSVVLLLLALVYVIMSSAMG